MKEKKSWSLIMIFTIAFFFPQLTPKLSLSQPVFPAQEETVEDKKKNSLKETFSDINLENMRFLREKPDQLKLDKQEKTVANLPLSPGDRIKITILGQGGEIFNGDYEINLYGYLEFPYLDPISVKGLDAFQLQNKLKDILLAKQFFKPELLQLSVQVLRFGTIHVNVSGEVFEPGRIILNEMEGVNNFPNSLDNTIVGDNPLQRYLTTALKSAGGIKPTADITNIDIFRDGKIHKTVDLSGIFTGESIEDIPLVDEDSIIVRPAEKFQVEFIRPSPITPDEIPLYVANLSQPSGGRALEGASRISETRFDYGSRLSQILISAQCLGGDFIQRDRLALLVRSDLLTKKVTTLEKPVEEIITHSPIKEDLDPFLMPNDGIACYDSDLANTRNFFQLLSSIFTPFSIFSNIWREFQIIFDSNIR